MPLQEYDIQFESLTVHYWQGGQGFPLLQLHGSGPGASTLGNWRLVLDHLVERYHVLAVDLIGFGKSGRKTRVFCRVKAWARWAIRYRRCSHSSWQGPSAACAKC